MFSSMTLRSNFSPAVEDGNSCKEKKLNVRRAGGGWERNGHSCPPSAARAGWHWHVPIYSKPRKSMFIPFPKKREMSSVPLYADSAFLLHFLVLEGWCKPLSMLALSQSP